MTYAVYTYQHHGEERRGVRILRRRGDAATLQELIQIATLEFFGVKFDRILISPATKKGESMTLTVRED